MVGLLLKLSYWKFWTEIDLVLLFLFFGIMILTVGSSIEIMTQRVSFH